MFAFSMKEQTMKILQVTAHYPPDFVSGGTLIPQRFALAVRNQGHESFVFAGCLNGLEALEVRDTIEKEIPVRWVGTSSFLAWFDERNYHNPDIAQHFQQYIDEIKPDIVHFHSIHTLGADMVRIAREAGARTILTMHDFWWVCARQFLANRELKPCSLVVECGECACAKTHEWLLERDRWLAQFFDDLDCICAPSRTAGDVLCANGIPEEKLVITENGVDAFECHTSAQTRDSISFMYAGGEAELKGYDVLKKACQSANVPDGTRLNLYNASADGFPQWVHSKPAYGRENLADIFSQHEVLILPSIMRESHSILTREALSAGLAVIATDTLGPEEAIKEGYNGLVVRAADSQELARAIERLANPQVCHKLTGNGSVSPIISKEKQEKQILALYDELYAGSRAAAAAPSGSEDEPLGNVLIVTGIQGAPGRYRGYFPVEALETVGVSAQLRHYRDPALPELAEQADAVVFYRVPATCQILDLIEEIRRSDTPIVGDIDDLIFDPEIEPLLDNLDGLSKPERDLWRRGIYRYRTTLEHCDYFIGSTHTISSEAERLLGIPSHTWFNGVGAKLAQVSQRALDRKRKKGAVRIGYFSGTDTHDADWASIERAIIRILNQYPNVELRLGGMVEPTEKLEAYAQRIERIPFVVWHELPRHLRNIDICLAPLTRDSIFNESKSAIKWLEAALVQTPTVASPTEPFRDAIDDGRTGILAQSEDEWVEAIAKLLDDSHLRASMGREAQRAVLMELSPARQGARYVRILEQARAHVRTHGHRDLSEWENVYDNEPFSAAAAVMEVYEIPRRRFAQFVWNAGLLFRVGIISIKDDGILVTGGRALRKTYRAVRSRFA
ncbi:MAG: glycosyltransferase [Actinomycetaceae bacterium]|nr:glycosyltransferase [Actinomycetaceae bacterium]